MGDLQYYVFFVGVIFFYGVGVFVVVFGIEYDDNWLVVFGFVWLWFVLCWWYLLFQIVFVVIFEQCQQWILNIGSVGGVEIYYQMFFKVGYWCEGKQLWFNVLFEFEDYVYGLWIKLVYLGGFNKGIVSVDLVFYVFQYRVQVNFFQIYYYLFWIIEGKLLVFQYMI